MKERALVIFTLAIQTAVGAFVTIGLVHYWLGQQTRISYTETLIDDSLLGTGLLIGLGLLTSFFHLGSPLNAWKAYANLRSSWLSREILFVSLFASTFSLFALLQWFKVGSPGARSVLQGVVAVFGIILVYSMARVYTLRTIPGWNNITTLLAFLATTLLLGSLAGGITHISWWKGYHSSSVRSYWTLLTPLQWILASAVFFLGTEFILVGATALNNFQGNFSPPQKAFVWMRLALMTAAITGAIVMLHYATRLSALEWGLWLVFLFALASETLGRMQFYQVYSQREL
jgi:anaerobic dimethyl sulfoxide reductase subunit C (anchor subunit)